MANIPVTGPGQRAPGYKGTDKWRELYDKDNNGVPDPTGPGRTGTGGVPLTPPDLSGDTKYIDPKDVQSTANRQLARSALGSLMQPVPQNAAARAAQGEQLKAKAASDVLAQRSRTGAAGMTTSGAGAASDAAVQRAGATATAGGMAQYDAANRLENAQRMAAAIGAVPAVQRTEFENEIFKKAMDEITKLKYLQESE